VTKNLGEYGRSLAESRRTSQREDFTTIFVTAEVDGDQLTSEEIASFFFPCLSSQASETTSYALCHGLVGLIRFPDQQQLWWDDIDGLRQTAVQEILAPIASDIGRPRPP
jgi:cytochrome P450